MVQSRDVLSRRTGGEILHVHAPAVYPLRYQCGKTLFRVFRSHPNLSRTTLLKEYFPWDRQSSIHRSCDALRHGYAILVQKSIRRCKQSNDNFRHCLRPDVTKSTKSLQKSLNNNSPRLVDSWNQQENTCHISSEKRSASRNTRTSDKRQPPTQQTTCQHRPTSSQSIRSVSLSLQ
jgi:hypothetical protein